MIKIFGVEKNKKYCVALFAALAVSAHIILPVFNSGKDFIIISTWNLFSNADFEFSYDLTWGNGNSYLFRDKMVDIKRNGINPIVLFYLVKNNELAEIREKYQTKIKNICNCDVIFRNKINSSNFDHFVLKKKSPILQSDLL